jgi:hypothetical protein
MAGSFVPTPGSYSNLSLLELEQLEKSDFYAGSKALTQGNASSGGFSLNAEPYFTGPELTLADVIALTPPTYPGIYLGTHTKVYGDGNSETVKWVGPTQLISSTTGLAVSFDPAGPIWGDFVADIVGAGVTTGDLLLIKDTSPTGGNAHAVAVVSSVAPGSPQLVGISALNNPSHVPSNLFVTGTGYSYVIVRPNAVQLFAVPGSGPLGGEQTFLMVIPGFTHHSDLSPTFDQINGGRLRNIVPAKYAADSSVDRADAVYDSPAPFSSLDKLGYRVVLYPDDGAGAPDLAHPITSLNPVIDSSVDPSEQRVTIDYQAGVVRLSCPPATGGDIKPSAGCVNVTTGRLNLYAVFWAFDTSQTAGTAQGLYQYRNTDIQSLSPARVWWAGWWQAEGMFMSYTGGFSTNPSLISTTSVNKSIGTGGFFAWNPNTQAPYLLVTVSNDGETPDLTLPAGTQIGQRITVQYNQPTNTKGRSGLIWKGSYIAWDALVLTPAVGFGVSTIWELVWNAGYWIPTSKMVSFRPGGGNAFKGVAPPVDYLNAARNLTQRFSDYSTGAGFPSELLHKFTFGRVGGVSSVWLGACQVTDIMDSVYFRYSLDDGRTWTNATTDPAAPIQSVVAAYDDPANCLFLAVIQDPGGGNNHVWSSTDVANWSDGATGRLTSDYPIALGYLGIDGTGNGVFVCGVGPDIRPLERSADAAGTWDNTVYLHGSPIAVVGFAANLHTGVALARTLTDGLLLKTVDRGLNWTTITSPAGVAFYTVDELVYLPGCGTWVLLSFNSGAGTYSVLNSTDDGVTWTVALAGSPDIIGMQAFGPSLLVATSTGASAPAYVVSADCGATWMHMDGGGAWDASGSVATEATEVATASVYGPFSEMFLYYNAGGAPGAIQPIAVSQRIVEANEEFG